MSKKAVDTYNEAYVSSLITSQIKRNGFFFKSGFSLSALSFN